MSQPQTGILNPSGLERLYLVFEVHDVPLTAMSMAKIGAMAPQLCRQVIAERPESKLAVTVGFGPQLWSFILPGNFPYGFRALKSAEQDGVSIPYTGGDMLFYFSSADRDLNARLADRLGDYTSSMASIVERAEGRSLQAPDAGAPDRSEVFLGNENPELTQSCFSYIRKWSAKQSLGKTDSFVNSNGACDHTFGGENPEDGHLFTMQFHRDFRLFPQWSQDLSTGQPLTGSSYFIPSLDLLTGLRMGGLRMGSLSPTAIWKDF
ncbi:MAG: hypothetical protein G3M78_12990 [Candidatus Nitrohelix vancouverensis]|uniref:Dyp-type peroxidase N-terminal domain-containing protein n=1 Tax=Candidatus Nitrohelix vancouverensis TaxID=2705534 RepID=A0A7T0G4C6_9BACT|nr:MAG: hypothetical protein G3M78_12990 [Candidatus Nitrohelix vancouverensis]